MCPEAQCQENRHSGFLELTGSSRDPVSKSKVESNLHMHSTHTYSYTDVPCTCMYTCVHAFTHQNGIEGFFQADSRFCIRVSQEPASPSGPGWYPHYPGAQQSQTAILSDTPVSRCFVLAPEKCVANATLSRMWENGTWSPHV